MSFLLALLVSTYERSEWGSQNSNSVCADVRSLGSARALSFFLKSAQEVLGSPSLTRPQVKLMKAQIRKVLRECQLRGLTAVAK